MNAFSDRTSAEVAEEAETERAGLVNTLDRLRENLRPENMVDEMFSQAHANSSDIMDKVWSVARANPSPAGLIGLGSAVFHPESSRVARMASGGRHGLAQSVFQVGGNAGSAVGPLLAAFVVVRRGQSSIAWFSLAALLGMVVLAMVGRWYRSRVAARRRAPAAALIGPA